MTLNYKLKNSSTLKIASVSFVSLILAHLMLSTIFPNIIVNIIGLIITSFFIYHNTLQKKDIFAFVMVIYFCSIFPHLGAKGGAFNLISLVVIILFFINNGPLLFENRKRDPWVIFILTLLILSSYLGWLINYGGTGTDLFYSVLTFFGMLIVLMISSRLNITTERIAIFLKINFILIIYSTIASLNKYLHIITFNTPMFPIYGIEGDYFEGGGLIGSSPLYGEHSLVLAMLFAVFLIFNKKYFVVNNIFIFIALIIAYINIFMSISRSVFLLSLLGLLLIIFFQFKVHNIKISKILQEVFLILIFASTVLYIIHAFNLDYVFDRVEEIENRNLKAGGITLERILDGSAFNREVAFDEGYKKYKSKESWLVGYGWGLPANNRLAFYVDPLIKRGSAHSQIFAVLFIFGWIGFIAYWGLIGRLIYKSFKVFNNNKQPYLNRILAYFFFIAFILFILNEIKVDSISKPTYFTVTMVWIGLGYANFNTTSKKKVIIK